jgi:3-deoxy-manno-octulosonate cytidylyltransferase (CMP-KDO synthetase)
MRYTVIIPARLNSTRLPNKPLALLGGLPMVVRVAERARLSRASQVVVATDSRQIESVCQAHGLATVLTAADHPSGTDRLAEACSLLKLADDTIVVNVQGDEPLIEPALIDAIAQTLQDHDSPMSTAAHPLASADEFHNPNVVKVVLDATGRALYFSRAGIPYPRDHAVEQWFAPTAGGQPCAGQPLRHIGIYGYRAGFLRRFPALSRAPLEISESLEQLRVLWHGHTIAVHLCAQAPGAGVDTPEDLARVQALFAQSTPTHPAALAATLGGC